MKIDEKMISQIKESKNVALYIHNRPDSDCVGSATAFKLALEKIGKKVDVFCEDKIPEKYLFIPAAVTINKPKLDSYDLAITLDVASESKLGKKYTTEFKNFEKNIKIDHHASGDSFAKINFVESKLSSCAMIIYYLLPELGVKNIDKDIACCLYSGIAGDTGCFRNANTMAIDHTVSAELIQTGFDLVNANKWLFKASSLKEIILKQRVLGRFKKYLDGRVGLLYIMKKDLKETNTTMVETESIMAMIDTVDDCQIAVMICEYREGLYKVSLRSTIDNGAVKVAQSFGGGGHPKSAGCQIFGTLNTVINKIIKVCEFVVEEKK